MIVLVLGGARSGKSAIAEAKAAALADTVTYLATAAPPEGDADFAKRVAAHRARRPAHWKTVECGGALTEELGRFEGVILVDSLGTWIAAHADFHVDTDALVHALVRRDGDTILVSEEVGLGVHPPTGVGRAFRDALGTLNQRVAAVADDVWLVVAGRVLPLMAAP